MDVRRLVGKKSAGGELSTEEIRAFVAGAADGSLADDSLVQVLAAIHRHGASERELWDLTRAMIDSGRTLSFEETPQPKADKHSTGGVGDKVSIPLAPAVAACGVCVPMISGRGLGHTGGTLDKLEAIPGFRTKLSETEIHRALDSTGLAFAAQSEELVPADRRLYGLRDAAGLVDSIPLIASSIMSKKLAEGISALVLDVKFGSGAFLPEPERGLELGRAMLGLAAVQGVRASVFQTAMDRPLGRAVGHALEIDESIDCLAGGGPADLRELVLLFGGEMLFLSGLVARRGSDNTFVSGDVRAQTRTIMENAAQLLEAAGLSFCDVVSSVTKSYTTASSSAMLEGRFFCFSSAMICGDSPAFAAIGACANHSTCERHCRPMIRIANSLSRIGTEVSQRR